MCKPTQGSWAFHSFCLFFIMAKEAQVLARMDPSSEFVTAPSRKAILLPRLTTLAVAVTLPFLMPCKKLVLSDIVAMPSSSSRMVKRARAMASSLMGSEAFSPDRKLLWVQRGLWD